MSNKQRIIEKLNKLLAMTGSTNEHEAMSATRKLHAMLAKHNIDMAELGEEKESVGQSSTEIKRCRPWRRLVAQDIARLYFCEFYTIRMGTNSTFMFVGTETNRTFALHIFKMVIKTVETEARKQSRELYGKEVPSFVNSFWTGAQRRISQRCKELITDAKEGNLQDEDGNTLPMLLNQYELAKVECQDFMSKIPGMKNKTTRTKADNAEGYRRGDVTGGKVQLSRAIQGEQAPKLLQ